MPGTANKAGMEGLADERGNIIGPSAARTELPVKNHQRLCPAGRLEKAIVEAIVSMNDRPGCGRELGLYPRNFEAQAVSEPSQGWGHSVPSLPDEGRPRTGVQLLVGAGFGVLQRHPVQPIQAGAVPPVGLDSANWAMVRWASAREPLATLSPWRALFKSSSSRMPLPVAESIPQ